MNLIFTEPEPTPSPTDLLIKIRHRILERAFGADNGEPLPAWHQVLSAFEFMANHANTNVIARHWLMMVFIELEPTRRQERNPDFRLCINEQEHFPHSRSPEEFLFRRAYRHYHVRRPIPEPEPFIPPYRPEDQ